MIGVPMRDPNTPPFEMVNDPPAMSSSASDPFARITGGGFWRRRRKREGGRWGGC